MAKATPRKKNTPGDITLSDFKLFYTVTMIKMIWYWNKNKCIGQWNRLENSELKSCWYDQQIFNKVAKSTQQGKDSLFNKQFWENWSNTGRTIKLNICFIPLTKN